jgi:hypothetical protein
MGAKGLGEKERKSHAMYICNHNMCIRMSENNDVMPCTYSVTSATNVVLYIIII